jgi:hypothetical protein
MIEKKQPCREFLEIGLVPHYADIRIGQKGVPRIPLISAIETFFEIAALI